MKNKKHFFKGNKIGFVLGAVLFAALTESPGNAGAQTIGISVPPPPIVAPPVVVEDNHLYYPSYGVYYNSSRHQYACLQGDAWVTAPAPAGVSVDVLQASPSVRMDWHDAPEHHHKEMLEKYPRNWAPAGDRGGHEGESHEGEGRK